METKNELMNIKVVQHNNLVTSIARMDRVPLKFFEFAVSALDTENPPEDRTVYGRTIKFRIFIR